jgi:hypothetical protein
MSRQEVVTAELSISRFALTVCDFSPGYSETSECGPDSTIAGLSTRAQALVINLLSRYGICMVS